MKQCFNQAAFAAIIAALAGCAPSQPLERPAVSPSAKVVGDPVNCVSRATIRETQVRDDWTIDFIGSGKRVWRNTLRSRCSGLRTSSGIAYKVTGSQICSVDVIYTIEMGGGPRRGVGCSLGQFVPVELEN